MTLLYIHTHDDIQKTVKRETSLLAVRRKDQEGNTLLDELVMDEAYEIAFRDYFLDARANVTMACSAYIRNFEDTDFFENDNFDLDKDFEIHLEIENFITALNDSISTKMHMYLATYIMYLWLETKLPEEAQVYLHRANVYLADMKRLLEMRAGRKIKITRLY